MTRAGTKATSTGQLPSSGKYKANHSDMHGKKARGSPKCNVCLSWGHTSNNCTKKCERCGKIGHNTHWCWEKNRRGVNQTDMFEAQFGTDVPNEPFLPDNRPFQDEGDDINGSITKFYEKRLLHVKGWMGEHKQAWICWWILVMLVT